MHQFCISIGLNHSSNHHPIIVKMAVEYKPDGFCTDFHLLMSHLMIKVHTWLIIDKKKLTLSISISCRWSAGCSTFPTSCLPIVKTCCAAWSRCRRRNDLRWVPSPLSFSFSLSQSPLSTRTTIGQKNATTKTYHGIAPQLKEVNRHPWVIAGGKGEMDLEDPMMEVS